MPILEIQGVGRVEVGEDFLKLPPEQQHATVQEIAASAKHPTAPQSQGIASYIPKAISDIPSEISGAFNENLNTVKEAITPPDQPSTVGGFLNTGKAIAAIPGMVLSPLTGAARSLLGHPMADLTHKAGELINPQIASQDNPAEMYQQAKGNVDTAMLAARPGRGGLRPSTVPPPVPPAPIPTGPLDVILSEGQTTRNLPAIQREQAALRGTSGPSAQGRAQEFADQQRQQIQDARQTVTAGLDQFGQRIAASPQEAAELAQNSIQSIAAQRKAGVTQAYDKARDLGGEIHAGAFEGIGQKIKSDLTLSDNPVIIDDKTTPVANAALGDIERTIDRLIIPNKADPFGQPNPENIVGVSLKGVEQIRKRLSSFRSQAYSSGNASDGRAMGAIMDSFDARVDGAVDSGLFNGDPRAVQAWKDARAAHADYKGTFTASKGDSVGRVVERITGNGKNPAAIPNDVADFLYGSSGVNPNSLNVGVANRVRGILGDQSPEWSGVKQGLFSRLVETPEGMADLGPGKVTQRLNQFLNGGGKELAEAMFSPVERSLLKQYADLHRALEIPQAGANWSNTATFLAPLLKSATGRMSGLIGAAIGHIPVIGKFVGPLVDHAGGVVTNAANARQIVKQMPLITEAAQKWRAAITAYNRSNTPPSRVALSLATTNFARSLRPLGIDLQSAGTGSAGNDQQSVPRPPGQ